MAKYLDSDGVLYLWNKIKAKFVLQETGKGLSTNDYTTIEKQKLAGIASGATKIVVDDAMSDTSTNPVQNKIAKAYIDKIGDKAETAEEIANKIADLILYNAGADVEGFFYKNLGGNSYTFKTDLTNYVDLSSYALKSDITNMYKYKGSVTNASNLPTSGQKVGDTYNIVNVSTYGPAGTNVSWDGSKWDALGGLFEIESITNSELDTICV